MDYTTTTEGKLQAIIDSDMFQAACLVAFMGALYGIDRIIA